MKKNLSICILLSILFSCKKDKTTESNQTTTNPYEKPWSTKNISYTNISPCGSNGAGYKIFYKDSLIRSLCSSHDIFTITDSLLFDDSKLLLFISSPSRIESSVLNTDDGGLTWQESNTGRLLELLKFHFVKKDLVYCITTKSSLGLVDITGIGKSNLTPFVDGLTKGIYYFKDLETTVTDMDSTIIPINDSLTFVIKFK